MNEELSIRVPLKNPELLKNNEEALKFILGKNEHGETITCSLTELQHLMIAGVPGMGKSTLAHSMITSLVGSVQPENLRLVLVDTKVIELGCYNGTPHLLLPVITEEKSAETVFLWLSSEIMRRLSVIAAKGCRSFERYNDLAWEQDFSPLPSIVFIVDDLAAILKNEELEDAATRILLHGRSAGVHFVALTEAPSSKLVSKLIPHFPSRICFGAQTKADSKRLIDSTDAADISSIGNFILYNAQNRDRKIFSTFRVFDDDIACMKAEAAEKYKPVHSEELMQTVLQAPHATSDPAHSNEEPEGDEMLPQAVDVVLETGQASVSMIQRRLKIGYARAARIVDEMEEKGIIGPFQGSRPRTILVTKEQWDARKCGEQMDFDDLEEYGTPEELPDEDISFIREPREPVAIEQIKDDNQKKRGMNMYCRNCGKELSANATVCPACGIFTQSSAAGQIVSTKKKWPAFWLCLLLGGFGVHRFYVGKIGTGVVWLLTGGVFGIGWLVDIIVILCGSFKDKAGLPLL